ncbi:MAG TPA: hypothetical protein VH092_09370 [Urbifossiella sp.]|nr:hypothetical protein [Urbifossiella sp.]
MSKIDGPREGLSLTQLEGIVRVNVQRTARSAWLLGWAAVEARRKFFRGKDVGWQNWVTTNYAPLSYPTVMRYTLLAKRVSWSVVASGTANLADLYELTGISRRPVKPDRQSEVPAVARPAGRVPRGIVGRVDDDAELIVVDSVPVVDDVVNVMAGLARHVGWLSSERTAVARRKWWAGLGDRAAEVAEGLRAAREQIDILLSARPEAAEVAPKSHQKPSRRKASTRKAE